MIWFGFCILLVVDNVLLTSWHCEKVTKNRQFWHLFLDVSQICFMSDAVKHTVSTCYRQISYFNDCYALRFLTLGFNFLYHYFK